MKCPYCFKVSRFSVQRKKGSRKVYYCAYCKSELPRAFIESPETQYTKIGMIGYTGHGKTAYKTSLLYQLKALNDFWNDFYFETFDDTSHDSMYTRVSLLEQGRLPKSTRAVFPRPTFFRLNNFSYLRTRFVSMFDTGGKLFSRLDLMTRKGRYLANCNTIFFFISLTEEDMKDNWNLKIMKLLDRYSQVIYSRYGIKTSKKQNILFVLTKSDELVKLNNEQKLSENIVNYFESGTIEKYRNLDENWFNFIKLNSESIESWLRANNCNSFINSAKNHFKDVGFVMTSALGSAPIDDVSANKLSTKDPKGVLDPLIWALHISQE
ncbi:MAG: GTPase domain-containing protein [Bacteroidota bacterium]